MLNAIEKYISEFSNNQSFLYHLGEITRSIYTAYKTKQFSNRDSLKNKRLRMVG